MSEKIVASLSTSPTHAFTGSPVSRPVHEDQNPALNNRLHTSDDDHTFLLSECVWGAAGNMR